GQTGMAKLDPRLSPAYSVSEAARYLRIPPPTVRSWVFGRDYPKRSGQGRFQPVVVLTKDPSHRLSFRNLIELAALRALRTEHAFKLSAVRAALDYARRELGVSDLLASKDLYARPGELFLEHYGQLINLNRAGQLGIKAVLQGLLQRIQWDRGLAVRFFPPLPNRHEAKTVMIDPRVSFGRPVLARLGVSTSVIVDRVNAGEEPAEIAKDYGATSDEIMDALAYERAA
ncbi:MAG: DUF433 domain-containing protein, partial [Phycisphaerales bacterium]|nr:DUF433 domain-containing protein [Phycisphaerales bacterium]